MPYKDPEKQRENAKKYRQNYPNRVKKAVKNSMLKKSYGISLNDYEILHNQQKGLCFLCGLPEIENRLLSVDHDHQTGKVRSLLCNFCNKGLGQFKDNPQLLRKAADYIERNK
jgi:hypothetical protein